MHRHQYKGRKFSREAGPRKALMRSLASQIILHERIVTTLEKAKEIQPIVEKLISKAKTGTLANRRLAGSFLSFQDKAVDKLFNELGPLFKDRDGGYTRITKLGARVGDNANMAQIELLDVEKLTRKEMEKGKAKKSKPEVAEKKTKEVADKPVAKKTAEKKPAAKKATVKKAAAKESK